MHDFSFLSNNHGLAVSLALVLMPIQAKKKKDNRFHGGNAHQKSEFMTTFPPLPPQMIDFLTPSSCQFSTMVHESMSIGLAIPLIVDEKARDMLPRLLCMKHR
jgi:hypothetical protein